VSQRRCCCTGSLPSPYACQPCPSGTGHHWKVQVVATEIVCDKAGAGALTNASGSLDCMRGSCGRVKYRRKALFFDTYALGVCSDLCSSLLDVEAPTSTGSANVEWSFCADYVNPFGGGYDMPDIDNTQSDAVQITGIRTNVGWDGTNCTTFGNYPCMSFIYVTYHYADSFTAPYYIDAPGCENVGQTINISRTWDCVYGRRVGAGQYFAEGQYMLLRCDYPPGVPTHGSDGSRCDLNGGTVCVPYGLTPAVVPTTWQPPYYVNLVRIS